MIERKCPKCDGEIKMESMNHCFTCIDKAFDLVKDPEHWKNPIVVMMEPDAWYLIAGLVGEAINFYTATNASCSLVDTEHGYKMLIEADGYYAGPAN